LARSWSAHRRAHKGELIERRLLCPDDPALKGAPRLALVRAQHLEHIKAQRAATHRLLQAVEDEVERCSSTNNNLNEVQSELGKKVKDNG